jgi:phage shock protein PspC (stress-responsive transcriptional regulator)
MTSAPPPAPPADPPAAQPPGPPPPPPPGPPQWSPRPPLRRSQTDKMIGGVAGGLAEYTGIDPLLWRVGFVALTLTGGFGILIYALLWLLMPAGPLGPHHPADPPAQRRLAGPRSPIPGVTIAALLIVEGVLVLLSRFAGWDIGPRGFLGAALLVVGLGLIAAAFSGRRTARGGLIALGVLLSLALLGTSAINWRHATDGVGDRTYVPRTTAEVQSVYRGGIGDMRVDLQNITGLGSLRQPIATRVDAGVGDVTIVVPRDADVRVSAHSGIGHVDLFGGGGSSGGLFAGHGTESWSGDGKPEIDLIINAGIGDVEVSRA